MEIWKKWGFREWKSRFTTEQRSNGATAVPRDIPTYINTWIEASVVVPMPTDQDSNHCIFFTATADVITDGNPKSSSALPGGFIRNETHHIYLNTVSRGGGHPQVTCIHHNRETICARQASGSLPWGRNRAARSQATTSWKICLYHRWSGPVCR